jgi:hypothetical protein
MIRRQARISNLNSQQVKVGEFVNSILFLSVGGQRIGNVLRLSKQACLNSAFMTNGDIFCACLAEPSNYRAPLRFMRFSIGIVACYATISKPRR